MLNSIRDVRKASLKDIDIENSKNQNMYMLLMARGKLNNIMYYCY